MSNQTSCPCPQCFKCCCHEVEGLDPQDCANDGTCTCNQKCGCANHFSCICEDDPRVNWLCQCGTGGLAVPESTVPAGCPTCGHPVRASDPFSYDDWEDEDEEDGLFDCEAMDGDHASALESVYGPND